LARAILQKRAAATGNRSELLREYLRSSTTIYVRERVSALKAFAMLLSKDDAALLIETNRHYNLFP
jgi:hypothetical protein